MKTNEPTYQDKIPEGLTAAQITALTAFTAQSALAIGPGGCDRTLDLQLVVRVVGHNGGAAEARIDADGTTRSTTTGQPISGPFFS